MKIDIKEITEGNKWSGKIVWICDFRRPDLNKKPIRHVKPTKVIVRNNNEMTKKQKIYYSENHFCKLNNKDEIINSGVIPVFDNTGYRAYTGVPVSVFDNEEECNKEYCNMANVILEALDNKMENILTQLTKEKEEILFDKSKYL